MLSPFSSPYLTRNTIGLGFLAMNRKFPSAPWKEAGGQGRLSRSTPQSGPVCQTPRGGITVELAVFGGQQSTQHLGGSNRIPLVTETVPQATNKYLQTNLVGLPLFSKVRYRSSLKKFGPQTDFRYGHFAYEWAAKN